MRKTFAVTTLGLLAAYAVAWPLLAPDALGQSHFEDARLAPGKRGVAGVHLLGTDQLGFDLSVRLAEALRVSLVVAACTALAATLIGVAVGAVAAFAGRTVDGLCMRVTDAVAALPHLLTALVVVAMFRGSVAALVIALALTHWPQVARVVRAACLETVAAPYVEATRLAGVGTGRIMRAHIVPAALPQAAVAVAMLVPHAVFHESTLSFLGVGLPPERASVGTLIADGQAGLLAGQWWAVAAPAAALIVLTVSLYALTPQAKELQ